MADVAFVGYTQASYESSGSGSVLWPVGAAVGHLALLSIEGTDKTQRQPRTTGWTHIDHTDITDSYCKVLEASDIAADLDITGHVAWLAVYSGAGRAYQVSSTGDGVTPGGRVQTVGSYLHCFGRGYDHPLTPSAGKIGADVRNDAWHKRYSNIWHKGPSTAAGYVKVGGSSNVKYSAGFEIVPLAGPSAPTLTSPVAGAEVDYTAATALSWVHRSSQSFAQQARQVRVRASGSGTWLYLQADGTIDAATAQVATASQSATIDAGELTTGTVYEWAVQTEDADFWSDWSPTATFSAATRPTVTAISVSSPAEDLSPTVTLTVSATGAHIATRIRLCAGAAGDPAAPLYDSGILTGAVTTFAVPASESWTNGAALRAWVEVRQGGGLWSVPTADDATFAVTWTPPTAPSGISAANPTSGPIQATITGLTGADWVQLQKSSDAGASWSDVATVAPSGASLTIQRPQMYGVPIRFRARLATLSEGVRLWSAWATMTTDVTPTDTGAYLSAEDGSDWLPVRVRADEDRVRVQAFSVTYPLTEVAGSAALVDSTPATGWSGRTTLWCATRADREALLTWLDAHPTFQIWANPEYRLSSVVGEPPLLVTLRDQLALARLAQVNISSRDVPLSWVSQ